MLCRFCHNKKKVGGKVLEEKYFKTLSQWLVVLILDKTQDYIRPRGRNK